MARAAGLSLFLFSPINRFIIGGNLSSESLSLSSALDLLKSLAFGSSTSGATGFTSENCGTWAGVTKLSCGVGTTVELASSVP